MSDFNYEDEPEYVICPYPYGTAEHLAWTLREHFSAEVAGYALWAIDQDTDDRNIAYFLNVMFERFGLEEAHFTAEYLRSFEDLPPILPETRKQLIINRVEQEFSDKERRNFDNLWDGVDDDGNE